MKPKPDPSEEDVRAYFRYDSEIGALYWTARRRMGPTAVDRLAGGITNHGYWVIKFFGKSYKAHRLIWIYHWGPIPVGYEVHHRDNDRSHNRIENLLLATPLGNAQHQKLRKTNSSGVRGVSREISHGYLRWRYSRRFAGRKIVKQFQTKREAIEYALRTERALQEFQTRPLLKGAQQNHGVG